VHKIYKHTFHLFVSCKPVDRDAHKLTQAKTGGITKQQVITVLVIVAVLGVLLVCSFISALRLPMVKIVCKHAMSIQVLKTTTADIFDTGALLLLSRVHDAAAVSVLFR
jgi:hypothetical protein